MCTFAPLTGNRVPTGMVTSRPAVAHAATTAAEARDSYRTMLVKSAPSTCPTSAATVASTSSGEVVPATIIATRRSAACSAASRSSSAPAARSWSTTLSIRIAAAAT